MMIPTWAFAAILAALPDDWPQWRGPAFTGSVEGGTWPSSFGAPAWKAKLPGKGGSTPIVLKDRIYLSAPSEGQDAVLAFDLDGNPRWEARLGPQSPGKHKTLGSSCNASPATDGRAIYATFRSGRLACLDLEGKVVWTTDLAATFGPEKLFWDAGSSPVVVGGQVILARLHGGESWVLSFDAATGALRWKQPRTVKAPVENDNGYATPVPFKHEGRDAVLVWGSDLLSAYDAADGALIWSCGGFNPAGTGYWPAISTPVIVGDVGVVPVGRDDRPNQARLHGIRLGGKGDVTATHRAWVREDVGVFVPTPCAAGGKVYLLRHRGELVCVDPLTGKTVWAEALPRAGASYYASPLVAGGTLYAAREDGVVFAARVDGGFKLLGENKMGERILASPVPAPGHLLFRGDEHLIAIR